MRDPRIGRLRFDGVFVAVDEPRDVVYVLRALGLGDLLTAVPALRGLRRHFPDCRIVLAAPSPYRELALFTGAVDELAPTVGLGDVRALDRPPALAVNLHGSGPQSIDHLLRLAPAALLSHRHPLHASHAGPTWRPDLHEVDRWCTLLHWAGIDSDPDDLFIGRPDGHPDRQGVVVVHPGAAASARRWPAKRFAEIAAALHDDGHEVVVTGSTSERGLALEVARAAGLAETAVLAGTLDLLALVALISDCGLLICGDTGVGHVATATMTPSVLLFGPTSPTSWGPRDAGRHLALWAGDIGDPHGDRPHDGLLKLAASDVLAASRSMLGRCA
jgi:ADP-heptose:LPS heptosyltransferase